MHIYTIAGTIFPNLTSIKIRECGLLMRQQVIDIWFSEEFNSIL